MIWVLGLADIMAGLIFLANIFNIKLPVTMAAFFAIYLIIKGVIFILNSFDFGSALDVLAGIILMLTLFFHPSAVLMTLFAIYLIGKGGLSMVS